jgi:pilus assembly protein CpaE
MIGQLSVEHPKLPILTISHDHQALLQSLQKGAKYFLTHPVGLEDMLAALRRALGEANNQIDQPSMGGGMIRANGPSQMITILGSRGGVGTTSLAVNLAATLASDPSNGAALVDLDLAAATGLLARRTKSTPA